MVMFVPLIDLILFCRIVPQNLFISGRKPIWSSKWEKRLDFCRCPKNGAKVAFLPQNRNVQPKIDGIISNFNR